PHPSLPRLRGRVGGPTLDKWFGPGGSAVGEECVALVRGFERQFGGCPEGEAAPVGGIERRELPALRRAIRLDEDVSVDPAAALPDDCRDPSFEARRVMNRAAVDRGFEPMRVAEGADRE